MSLREAEKQVVNCELLDSIDHTAPLRPIQWLVDEIGGYATPCQLKTRILLCDLDLKLCHMLLYLDNFFFASVLKRVPARGFFV